ncbi:GLRX1 protein, partial [Zapornia atra]|nr:GLRX1 protein [Zapornia atra]
MADRFVRSQISDHSVTLFVTSGCPYSRNAMEMLKSYNFVPDGLRLVDITVREDVQSYLQQRTGQRSAPHVFIGKYCIGGFSDLQSISYDLPRMLQQIGAL